MTVNRRMLTLQIVGLFVVFALALFGAAGTVTWLAGWAFLLLFFGFVVAISLWLLQHNPGLLTERMTGIGKADQKTWDKFFYVVLNLCFFAWLIVMPLDVVRFGWSHLPFWVQVVGALLMLLSFYLFFVTFRANSYLSPAVRIQSDRGQAVVSTGPYAYVRHPMYAAALFYLVGTALLLGSLYGLLAALLLVGLIGVRAVLEEQTLVAELPGYDTYLRKVRYRLIPYLW